MSKAKLTNRQQQLINAHRACLALVPLTDPDSTAAAIVLTRAHHGEAIADLIEQFSRLHRGEINRARNAGPKPKGERPMTPTERSKKRYAKNRVNLLNLKGRG